MNPTIKISLVALSILLAGVFAPAATAAAAGKNKWTVVGSDRMDCIVLEGDAPLFRLNGLTVGHKWIYPKRDGLPRVENGKRIFEQKGFSAGRGNVPTGGLHDLRIEYGKSGDNGISIEINARPDHDQQYGSPSDGVGFGFVLTQQPYFRGGTGRVVFADGKNLDLPYPLPLGSHAQVKTVVLKTADGQEIQFRFDPPLFIHCDNDEMRMFASPKEKTPAGGVMKQTITMTLPQAVMFEPGNRWVDTKDWLVYEHKNDFSPGSVIGMEDWLDKPAGKHGWLKMAGDDFVFADGTKVRFWGSNISYSQMAMPAEMADQWNDKFAKHGVNLVRLHKWIDHSWAGIMTPEDHMIPDPVKIKLFDYYHASAKKRGIYLGWSASYRFKLTPADKDRVWFYDEVAAKDPKEMGTYNHHMKSFAPDIQDLLIKQTINLLTRTNTATGIRYADDPALAYIELHNEEDIFMPFDNLQGLEKDYPKYFGAFQKRFNEFLKKKYGSPEVLQQAWGKSYPQGKSLGGIRPHYPSWGVTNLVDPYMADTMRFMYEEQHSFYTRFSQAIRETGYQGAICGSCWQAANWPGHLLNTLTDYEAGFIDRHNYMPTLLNNPGVGNMSVGFQQVKGRPFNFSEWGGGPVAVPTVAIYGLGLQGWDASCQFSSSKPFIFNQQARGCNTCCDDFIQIGQYPALARAVYRGDVKEGEIVANRRVSIPDLFKGKVGFLEAFSLLGGANQKEFSSVVPSAALMAGRVLLEFVDGPTPEQPVIENVAQFNDAKRKVVRSTTGQLLWDYSGRGYYTVNTPGTQAVFGHVHGKTIELADVTLTTGSLAPVKLYVTSLDKDKGLKDAERMLITAFGRDANTGMVFDEFSDDRSLVQGGEPLLLEPMVADITIKSGKVKAVYPLDHGGRRKDGVAGLKLSTVKGNTAFTIDGRQTKTMYYLVEMK